MHQPNALVRPSLRYVYLISGVTSAAAIVYEIAQQEPAPLVDLFIALAPVVAVGRWLRTYLRQSHIALPFEFGYLFLIGWPVLIPMVSRRATTVNRWRFAMMLYALSLAPIFTAVVATLTLSLVAQR